LGKVKKGHGVELPNMTFFALLDTHVILFVPLDRQTQRIKIMAGTRTTPAITGSETTLLWSLSWIDDNGKDYSNSFLVATAVTDVELEAIVATAQLAANASCWRAEKTLQWTGVKNASNADNAVHESVADKIRYSLKALSNNAYTKAYIPSPIAVLITDANLVDITQAVYTNWKTAIDAAVASGFTELNVEFVQYSQRNDVQSP